MAHPGDISMSNPGPVSDISITESEILRQADNLHPVSGPVTAAPAPLEHGSSLPGSVDSSPPPTNPTFRRKLPPLQTNVVHPSHSPMSKSAQPVGWDERIRKSSSFEHNEKTVTNLLKTLECPVCLETADKPPIYQCPEGHLLCDDCNRRLVNCPQCGHALMNSRNRTAEELAEQLESIGGELRDNFSTAQRITIAVGEPQKIRKRLFAHIAYQLATTIEAKNAGADSRGNRYECSRRYSEVVKLYRKLVKDYEDEGVIIPPPPEKSSLATVATRMSTNVELNESIASQYIEKRCVALDRYLKRLARHPVIRKDPNFRTFIQEKDVPKELLKSRSIKERWKNWTKGWGRLSNKLTVSEQDPWFQTKAAQLKELKKQMKVLQSNLKTMASQKSKLHDATNDFQRGVSKMSVGKTAKGNSGLAEVIGQVSDCHKTMATIHLEQSKADLLIEQLASDYQGLVEAAQSALAQRKVCQKNVSKAQKNKKGEERDVEAAQGEFEKINQTLRREFEHFDSMLKEEFEDAFMAYSTKYWKSLQVSTRKK